MIRKDFGRSRACCGTFVHPAATPVPATTPATGTVLLVIFTMIVRIVAHRWHIFLQRSPRMIFDAMNQGRLRPGDSLTNPICPCSTFSQAAGPSLARPSAAKVSRRALPRPKSFTITQSGPGSYSHVPLRTPISLHYGPRPATHRRLTLIRDVSQWEAADGQGGHVSGNYILRAFIGQYIHLLIFLRIRL
jgi:hypothetical protein